MSNLIPWIIAGAAIAAGVALYMRVRQALTLVASKQIDVDKLLGELKSTREQMERAAAKQRRATDEAVELRKKLEKVKRRTAKGSAAAPGPPDRLVGLETELEEARQARDSARDETRALSVELSRLRAEQAQGAVDTPSEPLLDNVAIEALQVRSEEIEKTHSELEAELAKARDVAERLRHKAKTQDTLYVSMRSELDAKKDRLRGQQEEIERLRAMQVVVGAIPAPVPEPSDAADVSAETETVGSAEPPPTADDGDSPG